MYFEDDEFIGGTPKSRFLDTLFHANRNVVEGEIEKILEWMAGLEMILEERCGLDPQEEVKKLLFDQSKQKELENRVNSLYLEHTANILSQSE